MAFLFLNGRNKGIERERGMITKKQLKRVASIWAYHAGTTQGEDLITQFMDRLNKAYLGELKKREFNMWLELWE